MSQRTCSIDDCANKSYARGWCRKHYGRWWSHGDPLKLVNFHDPEQAFLARTEDSGDCIVWAGAKDPQGYGQMRIDNKIVPAHRFAWQRVHGPIPPGMEVDHRNHCNPACVTVGHLRLATRKENGYNRSGASSRSKTKVRNVFPHGPGWRVALTKDGKQHRFGTYSTIEEAAAVAEQARRELFGEFAGRG